MSKISLDLSNRQLHQQGVSALNHLLRINDLEVKIAPKGKSGCKYKQTDLIVIGKKTGIRYELRVPTTDKMKHGGIGKIGEGYTWMMNEGNLHIKDPHFFYCVADIDRGNIPTDADYRFFIVPSPVAAKFLEETKIFLKIAEESHWQTFMIGHKGINYPPSVAVPLDYEYENNWNFFK